MVNLQMVWGPTAFTCGALQQFQRASHPPFWTFEPTFVRDGANLRSERFPIAGVVFQARYVVEEFFR